MTSVANILSLFLLDPLEGKRSSFCFKLQSLHHTVVLLTHCTCRLLLIAGRMGDLFGHRRVFLIGLFWFGLWSLVNGFSRSPVMLCISRALQGMGAAGE